MAYATIADLVLRFTELEIAQLTDVESRDTIQTAVAQAALDDAAGEIDSYINGVYAVPIVGIIPQLLVACNLDIARYRLYNINPTEIVRFHYLDAVAWLKQVASGRTRLPIAPISSGSINSGFSSSSPASAFTPMVEINPTSEYF